MLKVIALTTAFLVATSNMLSAQTPPRVVLSRPTPNLIHRIMESEGIENLAKFSFKEQPVCVDKRRYGCAAHEQSTVSAVKQSLRGRTPHAGWEFSLSPVRDSAGTKYVNLFTKVDPVEPGFASVSQTQFKLSSDGQRILSKKVVMSETIVSNR